MYFRLRKRTKLKHPVSGVVLAPSVKDEFAADDPLVLAYPNAFVSVERKDDPDAG